LGLEERGKLGGSRWEIGNGGDWIGVRRTTGKGGGFNGGRRARDCEYFACWWRANLGFEVKVVWTLERWIWGWRTVRIWFRVSHADRGGVIRGVVFGTPCSL
jgi:hypothetical protein